MNEYVRIWFETAVSLLDVFDAARKKTKGVTLWLNIVQKEGKLVHTQDFLDVDVAEMERNGSD
jgi:hypothetical protein